MLLITSMLQPIMSYQLLPTSTTIYLLLVILLLFKYKRQQGEITEAKLANKLKRSNLKRMPTPPSMPLIGHIHLMRDYQHNPWDGFNAIRKQYGDLVSLKMGVHKMVLISSVDHVNEVLIKKGHIFADRPNFPRHDIVFGGDKEHSLALCNWSNAHRDRRKFCKRGVVPNKLSARNQLLENVISEIVGKFMSDIVDSDASKSKKSNSLKLDNCAGDLGGLRCEQTNDPFGSMGVQAQSNLTPIFRLDKHDLLFLTGDIFMKFLCSESRPHSDKAYENFNIGCDFIFYDINQCYLLDFMPYLTSLGFGYSYLKHLKSVTDYCRYYIEDNIFEPRRRQHMQAAASSTAPIDKESPTKLAATTGQAGADTAQTGPLRNSRFDGGSVEADASRPFPHATDSADAVNDYLDSIIRDQLEGGTSMTLDDYKVGFADLLAGHAAVANILMRMLGHLALDPDSQDMICEEARRTKLATSNQTPPLPVTEAALQEALRIASSPIVPHVAREDSSIGGFFVPKGSAVLFNCYNVNLSAELWDEPLKYKPTRFLRSSKNELGETSYKLELPKHFFPFSVGQRQCLGYKMVESISVVAAANLCAKYKLKANNEALVRELMKPRGTVALNPLQECFELRLFPR